MLVLAPSVYAGEAGTVAGQLAVDADRGEARARGWLVPVQLDRHQPGHLCAFPEKLLAAVGPPGHT